MEISIDTIFIFNSTLKSPNKKPSDDEIQDAKLLYYYCPRDEELLIKRSNLGIIEGTMSFMESFEKTNEKFLFTELNNFYFIANCYESDFIICFITKKNTLFSPYENIDTKKEWLKSFLDNFYNLFCLYHNSFSQFFLSKENPELSIPLSDNKKDIIKDFIKNYLVYLQDIKIGFIDKMQFLKVSNNIQANILFSIQKIKENFKDIKLITALYKGKIIYNDLPFDSFSLLYNLFFSCFTGFSKHNNFEKPSFEKSSVDENKKEILENIFNLDLDNNEKDNEEIKTNEGKKEEYIKTEQVIIKEEEEKKEEETKEKEEEEKKEEETKEKEEEEKKEEETKEKEEEEKKEEENKEKEEEVKKEEETKEKEEEVKKEDIKKNIEITFEGEENFKNSKNSSPQKQKNNVNEESLFSRNLSPFRKVFQINKEGFLLGKAEQLSKIFFPTIYIQKLEQKEYKLLIFYCIGITIFMFLDIDTSIKSIPSNLDFKKIGGKLFTNDIIIEMEKCLKSQSHDNSISNIYYHNEGNKNIILSGFSKKNKDKLVFLERIMFINNKINLNCFTNFKGYYIYCLNSIGRKIIMIFNDSNNIQQFKQEIEKTKKEFDFAFLE